MRSGLIALSTVVVSFTGSFEIAATLMAGLMLVAGFVSGLTATLIAVLGGDLSVVFTASFGTDPRPSFATFLVEVALLATTGLVFRVSLPFVRFKDIISSDFGE